MPSNAKIVELLESIARKKASDLHLTAGNPPVYRINMDLVRAEGGALTAEAVQDIAFAMLSPSQKSELEKERELDFSYQAGDSRFRINIHFERGNVACSIRRIPLKIPTLVDLKMPSIISTFCELPRGLVLVTGPTGCGKSTTQAAMLDLINSSRACHIITIEDPIEYLHVNKKAIIEQREVGSDTLTFPNALKRSLRQDPDVILVGEMRDLDTIQTAITAAETGHLVISTLHTNDSAQAIDRMIDVFPPYQQSQVRLQLSMTLQGIIAQQLLPKKDKSGIVPALEILKVTPAVRNIIRKATTTEIYSVIETSGKLGMIGMDTALKELVNSGQITSEEALAHAKNLDELEKSISTKQY